MTLALATFLGIVIGAAMMILLGLYLIETPTPQPQAEHKFHAVSTGDMDAGREFKEIFRRLESGQS